MVETPPTPRPVAARCWILCRVSDLLSSPLAIPKLPCTRPSAASPPPPPCALCTLTWTPPLLQPHVFSPILLCRFLAAHPHPHHQCQWRPSCSLPCLLCQWSATPTRLQKPCRSFARLHPMAQLIGSSSLQRRSRVSGVYGVFDLYAPSLACAGLTSRAVLSPPPPPLLQRERCGLALQLPPPSPLQCLFGLDRTLPPPHRRKRLPLIARRGLQAQRKNLLGGDGR